MKRHYCDCGTQAFFESRECLHCGARLGFDPDNLCMRAVYPEPDGGWADSAGRPLRFCENGERWQVCNWLCAEDSGHPLCFACQFNRVIPNLSLPGNLHRWWVLEQGKKRLFYTLLTLGLPLVDGWRDPRHGLLLDFLEDGRSREEYAETFASTGFLGGVITINTLEADDVARTAVREEMNENYRTVLGHLRHESGHYYWSRLGPDAALRAAFCQVFGDDSRDYASALSLHYSQGPPEHWRRHYISAYASAHPTEDWAETWGHYLHIHDALETAAAYGLVPQDTPARPIAERINLWRDLSVTLNELNRSVGRGDAYPFVINSQVADKLAFVEQIMARLRTLSPARAGD